MRRCLNRGLNFLKIKRRKWRVLGDLAVLAVAATLVVFGWLGVSHAEQSDDSPDSGVTSKIKTIYNALSALSYGSDAAGGWGNWGAYLNRIYSAGEWTPSGAATAATVGSGSTFYSNSRSQQTGTYPAPSSCSTQLYHDSSGSGSAANNCSLTWVTASPAVTGDDKKDPRTGLIWSQYLRNVSSVPTFATSSGSNWSWDGTTDADSIACGNKTASQLCSERGNGWRLPTQKELLQAYTDGSFWNLTNPSYTFWSATRYPYVGDELTYCLAVSLSTAENVNQNKTASFYVRCVR